MERDTQLSAIVSPSVKAMLDEHVRATGMKKGRVIQDALSHHLAALDALPADVVIPTRILVSKKSMIEIAKKIGGTTKPTKALRELMQDAD